MNFKTKILWPSHNICTLKECMISGIYGGENTELWQPFQLQCFHKLMTLISCLINLLTKSGIKENSLVKMLQMNSSRIIAFFNVFQDFFLSLTTFIKQKSIGDRAGVGTHNVVKFYMKSDLIFQIIKMYCNGFNLLLSNSFQYIFWKRKSHCLGKFYYVQ